MASWLARQHNDFPSTGGQRDQANSTAAKANQLVSTKSNAWFMSGGGRGGREREGIDQAWNTTTGVQTLHGYRLSLSIYIIDSEIYLSHYLPLSSAD